MKISAKKIEKGMKIKVASVEDVRGESWTDADYSVGCGSISKKSPTLTIVDVVFGSSMKSYNNDNKTTLNSLKLLTEEFDGYISISTRQRVQII